MGSALPILAMAKDTLPVDGGKGRPRFLEHEAVRRKRRTECHIFGGMAPGPQGGRNRPIHADCGLSAPRNSSNLRMFSVIVRGRMRVGRFVTARLSP
jgi:hypothetical protein